MSYLVLARKWRPQRFDEVVGQAHVTQTLSNAIEMNRVAHAFLFSGVRGVGKTSLARILAKALNCQTGPTPTPCGECESCRAVTSGTAVDVIEVDGASNNSVEDIRNLRETVPFRPVLGKHKIYVIDEVHMLSTSAFNALLKTLEEPPDHVIFIFATTEPHKIPVTILSRCQRYDFRRIPTAAIVGRLATILSKEEIAFEDGALQLIGREAEGSMRDALSILDQVLAAGKREITADGVADLLGVVERQVLYDLSRGMLTRDPRRCLEIIRDVDNKGYDMATFSKGLLEHLRNLVVAGVCGDDATVLDLADTEAAELREQAGMVSKDTLHRLFKHFSEAFEAIARSSHPRILLETSVARIADLGELVPAVDLLARLERLAAGGGASGGPPSGGVMPGAPSAGSRGPSPAQGGRTRSAPVQPPADARPKPITDDRQAPSKTIPGTPTTDRQGPPPVTAPAPSGTNEAAAAEETPPRGEAPEIGQEVWERAIVDLKQAKPAMGAFLEYGIPRAGGGGLTISFNPEYASIAALAKDRLPEIVEYLQGRFGRDVQVSVSVDRTSTAPTATKQRMEAEDREREMKDSALSHPLVQKIQSEFGAQVAGVQLVRNPEQRNR